MADKSEFDEQEFTPVDNAEAKLKETLNAALEEHAELIKLRLERATMMSQRDELQTELEHERRRKNALAARVATLQKKVEALKSEVQKLRNERR